MAELEHPQTSNNSLVERALARIRKVADGNGLGASSFNVYDPQEKVVTFQGQLTVTPMCETASSSFSGLPTGGRVRQVAPGALQGAVEKFTKDFKENTGWYDEVLRELKAHENQGWGLEGAKVMLPEKSASFACIQPCPHCGGSKQVPCPQCQGKATIVCQQCEGRGRELCWHCTARGEDPQRPGQPCPICQGTRYCECRACRLRGLLPCPTCAGNRGVPCRACKGTGAMTQQVKVSCGAVTHFTISHEGLPSGFRRGLDRIGIANLGKGHGEITTSEFPKDKLEEVPKGGNYPLFSYTISVPYAELKLNLGGKKAIVSAVGNRCVLSGVPNFLDLSLKPWREKLHLAALGQAGLEEAMEARAVRDVLSLTLAGKGNEQQVRRVYPFGLSSEAIRAMLRDVRDALKRTTLRTRTIAAVLGGVLSAAFFFVFFMQGLEIRLTQGADVQKSFGVDLGALALAVGVSWVGLSFSTRFVLQRRFPNIKFALQQTVGRTGAVMVAAIVAAFVLFLLATPLRPLWLMAVRGYQ